MIPCDSQQEADLSQSLASKKMRMTLACVRCRSKKVKCDTAHPSCDRCSQAKVSCSYEGTSTQVDLFNIVKLNDIVDTLQQRVHSLESTIGDIHHKTQSVTHHLNGKDPAATTTQQHITTVSRSLLTLNDKHHHTHKWTLSLTPTGLRIDTNIATPPNLYEILLSGISQLDLDQDDTLATDDPTTCLNCDPLPKGGHKDRHHQQSGDSTLTDIDNTIWITRKTPLWRSKITSFPLYNAWSPNCSPKEHDHVSSDSHTCQTKTHHHHKETQPHTTSMFILDSMINIYNECFIGLPDTDSEGTIGERYHQGKLDALLANAIFAWSARHGAIYHNLFPGQDPNNVGECYFDAAKDLLKDRFMIPTMDTLHSLVVLYIYAIGRPPTTPPLKEKDDQPSQQKQHQGSVESEAYVFLGLAIRMCLALNLHIEQGGDRKNNLQGPNGDCKRVIMQMERYRRFFWLLYFLETLCALHSDRPFSLPSEDQITVAHPDLLDSEVGERRWRAEYMIKRFLITRIYRNIIQRTAQDQLLLSSISELDASLCQWYDQLPPHLQYKKGDHRRRNWQSNSFREQACVKLNFEYHFQRCQLYAVFMNFQQNDENSSGDGNDGDSTMDRKAREICLHSATIMAELMTCWKQLQQRWCHFSLESMMMAVNVFEIMMKDKDHVELARTHLNIMLDILLGSPIQHHRYVKLVIDRIHRLVYTTTSNNNNQTTGMETTLTFDDEGRQTYFNNNNNNRDRYEPSYRQHQHYHFQQTQQPMDFYNSTFRMQKLDGMIGTNLSDLPFSDFLYNPIMEIPSPFGPYTTATNTTIQPVTSQTDTYPPVTYSTLSVPSLSLSSIPHPPASMLSFASPETTSPSKKLPTNMAPYQQQQDLQPENDNSAASLWITLHQPTYPASNQQDSFDYSTIQQPH
ncbi:hypothetical protein BC941DRAFT_413182 [Chlamydoabsidia padenii]|nr:hypothetical protein BC941DRAFT_413182 [Chlamydoabsidia padenii]